MATYKLGNKITCIISAYNNEIKKWEPYTVLRDITASIIFDTQNAEQTSRFLVNNYTDYKPSYITLENVQLTDDIRNLIFPKKETQRMRGVTETVTPTALILNVDHIYDIFVYDDRGNLVFTADEWDCTVNGALKWPISGRTTKYIVFYSFDAVASALEFQQNAYFKLDIISEGSINDTLNRTYIHFDKTAVRPVPHLYFQTSMNTTTLTFVVIDDKDKTANYWY